MELRELEDVRYEVDRGLAWITIARPDRFNAFRGRTVDELVRCFKAAWVDRAVGVIALTGEGDKAFCAGGDQKQRNETGDYGPTETGLFEVETLHRVIRDIPKP
jgi:naphthoate synthase